MEDLDLVEFFSGKARVSRLASWMGLRVRSYDIIYKPVTGDPGAFKRGQQRRSSMDLNGAAGFARLGLEKNHQLLRLVIPHDLAYDYKFQVSVEPYEKYPTSFLKQTKDLEPNLSGSIASII